MQKREGWEEYSWSRMGTLWLTRYEVWITSSIFSSKITACNRLDSYTECRYNY